MGCLFSSNILEPHGGNNGSDIHNNNDADDSGPVLATIYGGNANSNNSNHPLQEPQSDGPIVASVYGGSLVNDSSKKDELSPIYESLPAGATIHEVRNVYDGDTLTLVDERRVRFLGIDTPELKEKQPFAQEAKDYTKRLCHKEKVYLTFEESNLEDHYGRLLAFVWVPKPTKINDGNTNINQAKKYSSNSNKLRGSCGYVNVNEGLVHAGLAFVYIPNISTKPHNFQKLIALQKEARASKRGLWSKFRDYPVLITKNGCAFHKRDCKYLTKSKNLIDLMATEATDKGLHPCRTCLADA